MRRITKAALGGLAGCALVLGGTQAATGALTDILRLHGESGDFLTSAAQPLDAAKAKITIDEGTDNTTTFSIRVTGIDPSIAGEKLGSHLHVGPCVEGDVGPPVGKQAGPHYNHDVAMKSPTVTVSRDTEVWFDLVADAEGMAYDKTTVPFVPKDYDPAHVPGVMSVVVHVLETDEDGTLWGMGIGYAGTRQACFPLSVPQWAE